MDKDILILAPNNENKLDTIYPITKSKNIKCNNNKTLEENLKETNDKIECVKKLAPEIDNLRDSIKNFKVSIGDAKPEDVLENKTFSNSTEVGLKGNIKNKGNLVITPSKSEQNFAKGLYNNIKCNPVTAETAKQSLSNDDINKIFKEKNPNLKPDNIAKDVIIAGIKGTLPKTKHIKLECNDISQLCVCNMSIKEIKYRHVFDDLNGDGTIYLHVHLKINSIKKNSSYSFVLFKQETDYAMPYEFDDHENNCLLKAYFQKDYQANKYFIEIGWFGPNSLFLEKNMGTLKIDVFTINL